MQLSFPPKKPVDLLRMGKLICLLRSLTIPFELCEPIFCCVITQAMNINPELKREIEKARSNIFRRDSKFRKLLRCPSRPNNVGDFIPTAKNSGRYTLSHYLWLPYMSRKNVLLHYLNWPHALKKKRREKSVCIFPLLFFGSFFM